MIHIQIYNYRHLWGLKEIFLKIVLAENYALKKIEVKIVHSSLINKISELTWALSYLMILDEKEINCIISSKP